MSHNEINEITFTLVVTRLLMIASVICSIVLLSVWNKNDVSVNLNTATALMMLTLLYSCVVIWTDGIQKREFGSLVINLLFFGIPFFLSAYVVGMLSQLKDKPYQEQVRVMQETNLNQIYKAAALLPISCICLILVIFGLMAGLGSNKQD